MAEFRYFAEPHGPNSTWTDEPQACELCGEVRPGYEGPYYGLEDVDFVCEPCLVAGRLAERDQTTNDGAAYPEAYEHRTELEQRTPHLVTWQDLVWPGHCGDYCRFERQVGRRELNELAPDEDGHRFLREHLADDGISFPLDWGLVPPDGDEIYDIGVYLFRCLECGLPRILWDAN